MRQTTCGPPLTGRCDDTRRGKVLVVHPLLGAVKNPDVADYLWSTPCQYDMPNCSDDPHFSVCAKLLALNDLFLGWYDAQNGLIDPFYQALFRKRFLSFKLYVLVTLDGK